MKKVSKSFLATMILFVVLGFLGGVVGELWLNSFLMPDPYLKFKSYSDLSKRLDDLIVTQEENSLHERDMAINETIKEVEPSVVRIYKNKSFNGRLTDFFVDADFVSMGSIITSDGWIVTSDKSILLAGKYWVVTAENEMYQTEKVYLDSKNTEVAFLKIEGNNLPVMDFSAKKNLVKGQTVLAFGGLKNININTLEDLNYQPINFLRNTSSESFTKEILLDDQLDKQNLGSPVITLDGKMLGIISDEVAGSVVTIDYLTETMKAVTQDKTWQRPILGIAYLDLAHIVNPQVFEYSGALVLSIKSSSPAKNVLKVNDIITKIESEELNTNSGLSEILSEYQVGDEIRMTIKRADEEQEVTVVLDGLLDTK